MSTETAPEQTTVEQNGHVTTSPGMGGTSTEENGRVDGADATGEGQERQEPEGAEPEGAERTGEEPAPREEAPDVDANYVANMEARVLEADAIARTIMADPARLREYRKWAQADGGGGSGGDDDLASIDRDIEESFPQQADRVAARKLVGPLIQRVRDLDEKYRTLKPLVEQSSRTSAQTELARSAEANGIPPETLRTKEWRRFVATEAKRDADLAKDLHRRPAYAGKNLARAWRAETGMKAQHAGQNRRAAELRDGRLHNAASPSRNGVEKVYVADRSEPGWDVKMLHARIAAESKGEKFRVSYATPKK